MELTPKDLRPPLCIINVYMYNRKEDTSLRQINILDAIRKTPTSSPTFVLGDWNFPVNTPNKKLAEAWQRVCARFHLSEASQDLDTYYRGSFSSRLDRIYHPLSESQISLACPQAMVIPKPGHRGDSPPSDHLPISLSYADTSPLPGEGLPPCS